MKRLVKWKVVEDFPLYSVSSSGGVKNNKTGKILKPAPNSRGYPTVNLRKNNKRHTIKIHHLVLGTFMSKRPEGKEANHKDGIKTNNYYRNLEWITSLENAKHACTSGLYKKGENHPNSKLKNCEVWLIRKLIKSNVRILLISSMFKVHTGTIYSIKNKRGRWKE